MALTERVQNQTNIGSSRAGAGAGIVAINTEGGTASGLVLISADGTEYVVWVRNNGNVMVGTRAFFATPQSAGTVVG